MTSQVTDINMSATIVLKTRSGLPSQQDPEMSTAIFVYNLKHRAYSHQTRHEGGVVLLAAMGTVTLVCFEFCDSGCKRKVLDGVKTLVWIRFF